MKAWLKCTEDNLFPAKKIIYSVPQQYGRPTAAEVADLRLNTGIDPTSHWASEQWTLLARRSEYR